MFLPWIWPWGWKFPCTLLYLWQRWEFCFNWHCLIPFDETVNKCLEILPKHYSIRLTYSMSDFCTSQNTSVSSRGTEKVHCFATLPVKCSSWLSKNEQEFKYIPCHYLHTFIRRRGLNFCCSLSSFPPHPKYNAE